MSAHAAEAVSNAVVALFYTALLSPVVVHVWPWDWRGRRKAIRIKPRDRDYL